MSLQLIPKEQNEKKKYQLFSACFISSLKIFDLKLRTVHTSDKVDIKAKYFLQLETAEQEITLENREQYSREMLLTVHGNKPQISFLTFHHRWAPMKAPLDLPQSLLKFPIKYGIKGVALTSAQRPPSCSPHAHSDVTCTCRSNNLQMSAEQLQLIP